MPGINLPAYRNIYSHPAWQFAVMINEFFHVSMTFTASMYKGVMGDFNE